MTIALVICEIGEIYVPDMLVWSSQHSVHVCTISRAQSSNRSQGHGLLRLGLRGSGALGWN